MINGDSTEEDIVNHNIKIRKDVAKINSQIEDLFTVKDIVASSAIPPCGYCKYDGELRCECCSGNCYEGFNIEKYPIECDS